MHPDLKLIEARIRRVSLNIDLLHEEEVRLQKRKRHELETLERLTKRHREMKYKEKECPQT